MFNIADYLKKFVKIDGDSTAQRSTVSDAIKAVCGIEKVDFEVKKNILYIKGSSVLKSVLYTKKAAILTAIRAANTGSRIEDIR